MSKNQPRPSPVTSIDVARLAGVSHSAVSRTYTPGASVSDKTRQKVHKAANELGYRVNLLARGLNKQKTDLVGMIASRMDNPYRTQQIDALAKRLVQKGLRPMLLCIDEGNTTEQLLSILLNYRVSGVVITSDAPPVKICDECARMGVPLVLVDRGDDLPFVDRVNGDDIKGGTLAAEAMINAGRRRFAVVQQHSLGYSGLVRISAFEARIAKQGFETQKIFVDADEYAGGAAAAVQVARLLGTDTGVFCPSDTIALGLIDGLQTRHNAQIPKDLSLIGYDDIPQARWVFADLTTIRQSVEQFAAATVQLLQDRIAAPDASPQSTVIDVELISRRSH